MPKIIDIEEDDNPTVDLRLGKCEEILKTIPSNSIDAVITDPPYGLGKEPDALAMLRDWITVGYHEHKGKQGFMGKSWDAFVPQPIVWKECLRVLKPGGHLLSFGGTRTIDLITLGLRIAGFEIRDTIAWVYGSGFPKSLDVSKAIDKAAGAERQVIGSKLGQPGYSLKQNDTDEHRRKAYGQFTNAEAECSVTAPATDAAKQWAGWGTALKPAFEPIIVARKPLIGTVAANVLEHGTGAINVDGCRVGNEQRVNISNGTPGAGRMRGVNRVDRGDGKTPDGRSLANVIEYIEKSKQRQPSEVVGRWPANFVHDGSDEVTYLLKEASRFFYQAKASRKDRGEVNSHPTVKPIELMRWLCRLVTAPNGIILDPYLGSGSTGKAALLEGFRILGIEREEPYFQIAKKRIQEVQREVD